MSPRRHRVPILMLNTIIVNGTLIVMTIGPLRPGDTMGRQNETKSPKFQVRWPFCNFFLRFMQCPYLSLTVTKKWGRSKHFELISLFGVPKYASAGSRFSRRSLIVGFNFPKMWDGNNLGRGSSNIFSQSRKYAEEQ